VLSFDGGDLASRGAAAIRCYRVRIIRSVLASSRRRCPRPAGRLGEEIRRDRRGVRDGPPVTSGGIDFSLSKRYLTINLSWERSRISFGQRFQ
jgi:hypothetical protein